MLIILIFIDNPDFLVLNCDFTLLIEIVIILSIYFINHNFFVN